jgi:tetratricopeptide (TPR) repeat protein
MSLDPSDALTRRNYLIFLSQEAIRADKRNNIKRAMEICEQQLSLDQNYEPALAFLASLYLDSKRKADAKKMIERIVANDPKSPQKRVLAGSLYLRHNMRKEAEALFKEAVDLEPSPTCFFFIGMNYLEAEEVKPALKYFDRAAEGDDADMLIEIAMHLTEAGYVKESGRYLDKAVKLDPSNPMPHVVKAVGKLLNPMALLLDPKGLKNALKEFDEARRLAAGKDEYKDLASELEDIKRRLDAEPPGGADLLEAGLPPFLFDDDDDDDLFTERRRRSRKRKGSK